MKKIPENDAVAVKLVEAIQVGDLLQLRHLLLQQPDLATTRIENAENGDLRSLLHIATDWPGHFPNVTESISLLAAAGADVNAPFIGSNPETPLHWAASSNDVEAIDALVDAGADLEARGAVLDGGTPLSDAIGFAQWHAAARLAERGAKTNLGDEAALGLMDRIADRFEQEPLPSQASIDYAFWNACLAGQQEVAAVLIERGPDVNWIPEWDNSTPLDVARNGEFSELVDWLRKQGGKPAPHKE